MPRNDPDGAKAKEYYQNNKHICFRCNLALGFARDNPAILRRLADYLCER